MRLKKMVALATAAAMTLSPMLVSADETTRSEAAVGQEVEGTGQLEGYVNKDRFRIVLPTVTNMDFTLDPQGLLNKADSSKWGESAGAMYFTQSDGTFDKKKRGA